MRREVRLLPEFADLYPDLDATTWYTAAAVAGRVKGHLLIEAGADATFPERLLSHSHFEFRGGSARRGAWLGARTRRVDRVGLRYAAQRSLA